MSDTHEPGGSQPPDSDWVVRVRASTGGHRLVRRPRTRLVSGACLGGLIGVVTLVLVGVGAAALPDTEQAPAGATVAQLSSASESWLPPLPPSASVGVT